MPFIKKLILIIIILNLTLQSSLAIFASSTQSSLLPIVVTNPTEINSFGDLVIQSEAAVLIDKKTGEVLYEKNMNEVLYPASITKIMTCLLLLEYVKGDMNQRVHFSREAVFGIERNSSHIAMDVDETLSVQDCLYAILLASANEVSSAVAEYVSGDIDTFAILMTKRAKELGAKNTNFVNANGLPDENHVTTALDMALIMKEVVKYKEFNECSSILKYSIPPTEKQPENRELYNMNKLFKESQYKCDTVISSKTGYTDEARHTLVSYAKSGDVELIATVLKGEKWMPYIDTKLLFDYGFANYSEKVIFDKTNFNHSTQFINDDKQMVTCNFAIENNIKSLVKNDFDLTNVTTQSTVKDYLSSSSKVGDIVGSLKVLSKDVEIDTVPIVIDTISVRELTKEELKENNSKEKDISVFNNSSDSTKLEKNNQSSTLFIVLVCLISLITICFVLLFFIMRKNKSSSRKRLRRNRQLK